MVKVDFTEYKNFSICPVWWRNFVIVSQKELYGHSTSEKHNILDVEIEKFHGSIVDADTDDKEDIDSLIFETEEDFDAFKLYWTLYGS